MSNRPNGVFKTENEYQQQLSRDFYESCPKAVLAAIAVSLMVNYRGVRFEEIDQEMKREWQVLNENGIVPQKCK